MDKNINLVEILKDCPKRTKLYSIVHGEVKFYGFDINSEYPIRVRALSKEGLYYNIYLTKYGTLNNDYVDGECILFPSKNQRDWNKWKYLKPKFDPKTLKPFDKVLVRDSYFEKWQAASFSHINLNSSTDLAGNNLKFMIVTTGTSDFPYCIPYNEDTKHLIGIIDDAPEYYRYWED